MTSSIPYRSIFRVLSVATLMVGVLAAFNGYVISSHIKALEGIDDPGSEFESFPRALKVAYENGVHASIEQKE